MQIISHSKHARNITQTERWVSAVTGGFAVGLAIGRRDRVSVALAALGADLLRRGATGHSYLYEWLGFRTAELGQGAETTSVPYELGIRVDRAVTIARPRPEIYRFWRDLPNLARFMKNVVSVMPGEGNRSHWMVKGPANRTVEWDAVIHNEIENELIAWRSLRGAAVDHAGSVIFRDAPGGRGTEVRVELQYNPPAGVVGAAAAALWGKEPSMEIEEDLHRLKQILETGEIPTVQGQTSGREATKAGRQTADHRVEEASEESFPASDAPAYSL
jgi:uncharacterized membrane protein